MDLTKKEKLDLLLKQIGMPQDIVDQEFQEAYLNKLMVLKNEKLWQFYIHNTKPFNSEALEVFIARIEEAFRHIANVDIIVTTDEKEIDEKTLKSYWKFFIHSVNDLFPAYRDFIYSQVPEINGAQLKIYARNETEANAMKKKIDPLFTAFCQKRGLKNYQIQFEISRNDEEIQQFQKQKQEEEKHYIERAIKEKEERAKQEKENVATNQPVKIGKDIQDETEQIQNILEEEKRMAIQGYVFDVDIRNLRSGRDLLIVSVTDYSDSIQVKMFSKGDEQKVLFQNVKEGMWIKARGSIQTDTFTNELMMMGNDLHEIAPKERLDQTDEKRVELHAHTTMSQMDATVSASNLIERAAKWGHKAVAITDHAVVQAFPEAHGAGEKHGVKVLYGLEANLVDDGIPIAYNEQDVDLNEANYIVFDVETTGLSASYDKIIELAAVKVYQGEIIDRFERFANPHQRLSQTTIDLTGITDDMVKDAPEIEEVMQDFYDWMGQNVLVAHNASFDIGFINAAFQRMGIEKVTNPVIDTLELARFLYPELKNHRLNTLCKQLNIELTQHHRAIYDAEATGYLLWSLVKSAMEKELMNHQELNRHVGEGDAFKRSRPSHVILLAQTQEGLKNLFKLVSLAHVDYFYRVPRIPRSKLVKHREGLLVGSGCDQGELFDTIALKSEEEAEKVAEFYDYIEVQPTMNYYHLIEKEQAQSLEHIKQLIKKLVKIGDKLGKKVVATGNTHYLDSHEKIYRQVLIASQSGNPLNRQTIPDVYFKTTHEMLDEFAFLGEERAKEIVVTNTNWVADQIEDVKPIKDDLYTPNIEGADDEIRETCYNRAISIYGEELPDIVVNRLEKELKSIIENGFSVIYLISEKLVKKSLSDGYLVGSRGSVGSSFVATMLDITEVNPLPPHYVCDTCSFYEFYNDGSVGSGFDLPEKECPNCGQHLIRDGQDIPFETFLGFKGDKVPDIDLNFSGEYQPQAHHYTKVLFGEDNVYRAGTIGTVAEKTAFGYVKGYAQDKQLMFRQAEISRLVKGCTGVKRTTGQHPGGIIVVPDDQEIYDFTPVQYPADDRNSEWKTTHFDFHSIDANLLKLDILGHDDPTVIRMLQDLTGIDPYDVPTNDPDVMKIFEGPEPLGVTPDQIMCKTGTLGVPEFGTRFVRQMLEDTKPSTFAELVIISGLSHGTDVWLGNAQELINDGICEIGDVIGCRDDIMVYLMHKGLEASLAFTIMEHVRKGKGLSDEWIEEMKKHGVPDWYIDSCLKIKYMFPKAHAAAYVLMAVRIAYFKVHYPIEFYAAYFTVRASDFELDTMIHGSETIRARIEEIQEKGNDASPKEKSLLTVLEIALEMCERGYTFQKVDLYRSTATEFIVDGNTLIPPFNAVDGLGTNAAINIVKAKEDGEFLSKQDLRERSKISKTVLEYLDQHGCLEGLPDQNQLSLF
ncbi:PolC-type DNA polymerase III [Tenuibacillus multivorans]|uniref:DNA polymerase III PolC-type n=1 Tax=Tenuibacillus multivorans TaxID=237069 RepID=A0A1G9XXR9_9BACI|nr:PolC-type DNA polymerase III [Tenuibacillus multivorans]GEL75840.1 DNA polymerase III PolC-type [Tenuibacillus multivorans]SDN00975.1 DNA polymerase-3 subunit alpha [Tenuibacillus multivorans]